jgi:hypothetical protein
MMRKLCTTAAVSFTVAAIALGNTPVASAITGAPFTAELSGHAAITGLTTFAFTGQGTASYLGPVTDVGKLTVTGLSTACLLGLPHIHVEILTNAQGETLTITLHDLACLTGLLRFHGTGVWAVTGGTGRFAGASGSGTAVGAADFVAGKFAIALSGTVTAPMVP